MNIEKYYDGEEYNPPEPQEIRDLLKKHDLSGSKVGKIIGAKSRNVRRWTSPEDVSSHQKIPLSAWILLLAYTEEIKIDEYKHMLEVHFDKLIIEKKMK